MTAPQNPEPQDEKRTFTDEMEVAANDLVDKAKELVAEGNVRKLIVRKMDGEQLIEVPLTPAMVVSGALLVFQPWLAMLGAIAAFVTKVKLEVVRVEDDGEKPKNDDKERIEID
ncbi:MAG: DUF4342 domain-containing protein [Chloroflexota bacterium]